MDPARPARIGGKPNFSGIWQANNEAYWDLEAHAARRTRHEKKSAFENAAYNVRSPDGKPPATALSTTDIPSTDGAVEPLGSFVRKLTDASSPGR